MTMRRWDPITTELLDDTDRRIASRRRPRSRWVNYDRRPHLNRPRRSTARTRASMSTPRCHDNPISPTTAPTRSSLLHEKDQSPWHRWLERSRRRRPRSRKPSSSTPIRSCTSSSGSRGSPIGLRKLRVIRRWSWGSCKRRHNTSDLPTRSPTVSTNESFLNWEISFIRRESIKSDDIHPFPLAFVHMFPFWCTYIFFYFC